MARSQNTSKTKCPACKNIQEDCAKAEKCAKWKTSYRVCMAFSTVQASDQNLEGRMRKGLRDRFRETRLLEFVVRDLHLLFEEKETDDLYARDFALPGSLWDVQGAVEGGVSYGRDGAGESPETPER